MKILDEMFDANINDPISIFENELDALGTNADTQKYLDMLQKAPVNAPSLPILTNFVQSRMSA